jgi:fibronectin-binding autotransporter adhesin
MSIFSPQRSRHVSKIEKIFGKSLNNNKNQSPMKTLKSFAIITAASLVCAALSVRADITTGLEGAWTLGDGPGSGTVADSSGNGNTGTLLNFADTAHNNMWTATTDPINQDSYAINFNSGGGASVTFGSNTCVSIPDSTSLDAPTTAKAWTLSAWVNCAVNGTNEPANAGIVCKGILGVEQYSFYMVNGHFVANMRNAGNTGGQTVTSTTMANSNTWYHVVVTFTTSGGPYHYELPMYINGVFNADSAQNTYTTVWSTNQPVYIGAHEATSGIITNPFVGIIDQVRIYNRALSPTDILQLYQNGNYWDQAGSKSGTGSGGTGNWDSISDNWWVGGASAPDTTWPVNNAVAYFGGTAGTVTLNANESAEGLTFLTSGYTVVLGTGTALTLTNAYAGGATIKVNPGASPTTISCPIAGSSGLTVGTVGLITNIMNVPASGYGSGTLVLSGANTYTGVTTLNPNTVVNLGSAETPGTSGPLGNSAPSNPGSIVLAGGTLQYSSVNQNDYSGRFSTAPGQAYNIDLNGQNVAFATALSSSGSTLTLSDSGSAATLNVQNGTIGGNVLILGGTLELNSSSALSSGAIVTLPGSPSAAMNLNFSGTQNISALNFGATSMAPGTYGSTTSSAVNQSAAFTGNGVLNVTGSVANSSYWDPGLNNSYPGSGGNGIWDSSSTADWYNGSADVTFPANTIACFAGTNGTVNLNASLSVAGLTFYSSGYTVSTNGAGTTLTLSGTSPAIYAPAGTITFNCFLAGNGPVFNGPATYLLNSTNNTFVGATISPGATVQMNYLNAGGVAAKSTITDNGTFNVNIAAQTLSNTITGNGTVNIIETVGDNLTISSPMSSFTGTLNCPVGPGGAAKAQITSTSVAINSAATINVANGGTFYLVNNGVTVSCPVNLYGIGNNEIYGALRVEGGATVSGAVTLYSNVTIGANSGIGTISGAIGDGGNGYSVTKTTPVGAILLTGVNTYSGPTIINGGVLAIGGSGSLGSGNYAGAITDNAFFVYDSSATQTLSGLIIGSGAITNNGPGTLILTDTANDNSGTITLNGGIFDVPNQHPIGAGSGSIVFNGGTLENDDTTAGDGFALNYGLVLNAGGGILSTPTAGQSLVVGNLISGTGSLTKIGLGAIVLTNADTYSGATIISAGGLGLSGVGSIANTPNIIIAGGAAFDVSALSSTFGLGASQTISNNTSTATIAGSLNTGSGTLSLTYAAGTPSLLVKNGTLTLSASTVVNVNNTGAALPGGAYVIAATGAGGAVAGTLPSVTVTGGGIIGGATASLQIIGGALNLVVTPPTPTITAINMSGTTLNITAINGADGGQFILLGSTNLLLPLNQWTPVLTNVFSPIGNLTLSTNIINPGIPYEFYILVQP